MAILMTDTTRDLIQRLADELTNAIRIIYNEDGTQHISTATPLLAEARAYLAQPEPKGPTVMEIIELADEIEAEELGQVDLVRRALARWGRPVVEFEPKGPTDTAVNQAINSPLL